MFPIGKIAAASLLGLLALAANAQVYRIVGPDGRVTFSDRPPEDRKAKATTATPGGGGGQASAQLPFELRSVASKFPVTFYTGNSCDPCVSGRNFLNSRGIPFTERTVTTKEDFEALQRMTGNASMPLLTIGSQQIKGFSEIEWAQFLDAAGYPKTSALPASYRNPAPSPLVTVQQPATQAEAAPRRERRAAPAPTPVPVQDGPTPDNPAGIRF